MTGSDSHSGPYIPDLRLDLQGDDQARKDKGNDHPVARSRPNPMARRALLRSVLGRIRDPQDTLYSYSTRLVATHYIIHLRRTVRHVLGPPHSALRRPQDSSTGLHAFTKLLACCSKLACFDYSPCSACHQDRGIQRFDGWTHGEVRKSGAGLWFDDCELRGSRAVPQRRVEGSIAFAASAHFVIHAIRIALTPIALCITSPHLHVSQPGFKACIALKRVYTASKVYPAHVPPRFFLHLLYTKKVNSKPAR